LFRSSSFISKRNPQHSVRGQSSHLSTIYLFGVYRLTLI
jgi:hypothetical protein